MGSSARRSRYPLGGTKGRWIQSLTDKPVIVKGIQCVEVSDNTARRAIATVQSSAN